MRHPDTTLAVVAAGTQAKGLQDAAAVTKVQSQYDATKHLDTEVVLKQASQNLCCEQVESYLHMYYCSCTSQHWLPEKPEFVIR